MAKKTKKSDNAPEAVAEVADVVQSPEKVAKESSGFVMNTTGGNQIDKVRVYHKDGTTFVRADYGTVDLSKSGADARKGMKTLPTIPLSPENSLETQRLLAIDSNKAKDFAVRTAYPMFVDDKKFIEMSSVNNRPVTYAIVERITASKLFEADLRKQGAAIDFNDAKAVRDAIKAIPQDRKEAIVKENARLYGKSQLSFGSKGDKDSRFFGVMTDEERACYDFRAEVKGKTVPVTDAGLDANGKVINVPRKDFYGMPITRFEVESVGKPLTVMELAEKVENRVREQRQNRADSIEKAGKVSWGRFKLPESVKVTDLHYVPSKDHPDRVWINGKVNGLEVRSLLSVNETTALRNKMCTAEQAAAANTKFMKEVNSIIASNQSVVAATSEDVAIKAVVDRASDPAAKSFSAEQVKVLNDFNTAETSEERSQVFDRLFESAKPELDAKGVNEAWQKDVKLELRDLAEGVVRSEQRGISV